MLVKIIITKDWNSYYIIRRIMISNIVVIVKVGCINNNIPNWLI